MGLREPGLRRALTAAAALALSACVTSGGPADAGDVDAASEAGTPDAQADAGPLPEYLPVAEPGRHDVAVTGTRQIIPSDGLPPETPAQHSNNNLDAIRFGDRVYLVWRTAPTHFASPDTRMHVVSSTDEVTWTHEASFQMSTDLRECRFLVVNGTLFLYISRLGNDAASFQPQGFSVTQRAADGTWSALTPLYDPGYIAWRTKTERGTNYVVAYVGGEHIYDLTGLPISVALLTTTDGTTLAPLDPAHEFVSVGGGSETDFALGDDGTLFGVVRNEEGEAGYGFGMKVCRASAGALAQWTCHADPRKYDSPLMFWYDGEAYLVGRRNVTPTGNYDLMRHEALTLPAQEVDNQTDYARQRKRCSLWRYVQSEDRIAFVTDLPSRGDTCFAARIDGSTPGEMVLYDYSSPLEGPDVGWNVGQNGDTRIYRHVLRFTPRP